MGGGSVIDITRGDNILFRTYLKRCFYQLFTRTPKPYKNVSLKSNSASNAKRISKMQLWHRSFPHISPSVLIHTCRENGVRGLADLKDNDFYCEVCKINKFRRPSFLPIGSIRSEHPSELWFADVCGPCRTVGKNGKDIFCQSWMTTNNFSLPSEIKIRCI